MIPQSAHADTIDLTGGASRPVVRNPTPEYVLRHMASWEVATVGESVVWLPILGPHFLVAGVNGVRWVPPEGDQKHRWGPSVASAMAKGWTYPSATDDVPVGCLPAGVAPGPYRRKWTCSVVGSTASVPHWATAWEIPQPGRMDAPTRWVTDHAAYNLWRLHLLTTGEIPAAIDADLDVCRDMARKRLERIEANTVMHADVRKVKLTAAKAVVKAVESAEIIGKRRAAWAGSDPIEAASAARKMA